MGKTRDLVKKIRDTKEIFHAKMDTRKDRNDMDLTQTDDIKKRWQEYTEVKQLSRVRLFTIPWTVVYLLPWDFPGKSTGVGCHFLLHEYTEELYKKDL